MSSGLGFFDSMPKERRSEFYEYNGYLDKFLNLTKGGARLVIIEGLRRMGKTSLLKVGLNEAGYPYLFVDARPKPRTDSEFLRRVESSVKEFAESNPEIMEETAKDLKNTRDVSVDFNPIWIRLDTTEGLRNLLISLNKVAHARSKTLILAIDEVQELRYLSELDIGELLSFIYDNLREIRLILTGSEVGLMYEILTSQQLKPRNSDRIILRPLTQDQATEFLRLGFQQNQLKEQPDISFINKAYEVLGGNIGWLATLGQKVVLGRRADDTLLNEMLQEYVETPANEVNKFLSDPLNQSDYDYYMAILRRLCDPAQFPDVIRAVQGAASISVTEDEVRRLIANLKRSGFVDEDKKGNYTIPDPVLREALGSRWQNLFKRPQPPKDEFESFLVKNSYDIGDLKETFGTFWSPPGEWAIQKWIQQFPDASSWSWALRLLKATKTYYYSHAKIDDKLKVLHNYIPEEKRRSTYVTFLGPPQKRENQLAAEYNKVNNLKKSKGVEKITYLETALRSGTDVGPIVFLTDIIGSGKQVLDYYEMLVSNKSTGEIPSLPSEMSDRLRSLEKYCFAIVGTEEGVKRITDSKIFSEVKVADLLTDFDKAFSPQRTDIFENNKEREEAKRLVERIGTQLYPRVKSKPAEDSPGPFGFGNSELLVVFHFNTPNNTLPILWKEGTVDNKTWHPILKRME